MTMAVLFAYGRILKLLKSGWRVRTFLAVKFGAIGTSAEAGRPAKQISAMLAGLLRGDDR